MLKIATKGRAAPEKSQQKEQSSTLETIFNVVDQIKSDLSQCGKGLGTSSIRPLECGQNYYYAKWKDDEALVNAGIWYDSVKMTLSRKNGSKRLKVILKNVTDFYISYFTSSNSLLYRIELNHKEQIRGYIFLSNLTKKEDSNESEN